MFEIDQQIARLGRGQRLALNEERDALKAAIDQMKNHAIEESIRRSGKEENAKRKYFDEPALVKLHRAYLNASNDLIQAISRKVQVMV